MMEGLLDKVLIVDFECTCDVSNDLISMEIIEFGAVMLDFHNNIIIDKFQHFVKPTIHHPNDMSTHLYGDTKLPKNVRLSEYCKNLTTITQHNVDTAPKFPSVWKRFVNWIGPYNNIQWTSWGRGDYEILNRECHRNNINYYHVFYPGSYFNLKTEFSNWAQLNRGRGCRGALEMLNIQWTGKQHRALVDAENTAQIYMYMRDHDGLPPPCN